MVALADELASLVLEYIANVLLNHCQSFLPVPHCGHKCKTWGQVTSTFVEMVLVFVQHPEHVAGMLAGLDAMESWSRTENLPHIACPTLIIWGEQDRTYGWNQIEELWQTIPKASLAVMPGCSHAAHMEKPALFNHLLEDFLA